MPLADCLRPFNQSDRHKVQPLINELRQAVGDDHLLGIQTELFDVLVKIIGYFPLSSGSGYFWPGSYIDFSLKLSSASEHNPSVIKKIILRDSLRLTS